MAAKCGGTGKLWFCPKCDGAVLGPHGMSTPPPHECVTKADVAEAKKSLGIHCEPWETTIPQNKLIVAEAQRLARVRRLGT